MLGRILRRFKKARQRARWSALQGMTEFAHVRGRDLEFFVDTREEIGRRVFEDGNFEEKKLARAVEIVESRVPDLRKKVFVDVGANIGTTTLTAVKRLGFLRALAFEPEPTNFKLLRLNCVANDASDRIDLFNVALTDERKSLTFALSPRNSGDHRVVVGAADGSAHGDLKDRARTTVPGVRLDDVLAEKAVFPADLGVVWIDAQGHESFVLKGAASVLEAGIPLCLEVWPHGLGPSGGVEPLAALLERHYTHFCEVRKNAAGAPEMTEIGRFGDFARRIPDGGFTDVITFRIV